MDNFLSGENAWLVLPAVIGIIWLLVKIFGTGGGSGSGNPCELTGSSGCM